MQAANLAWALIEVAKPFMNAGERNYVFVTIGAGDMFAAIRSLINLVAAKGIPLRTHLVLQCSTWLDAYDLHDEYQQLRGVINGFRDAEFRPSRGDQATVDTAGTSSATGRYGETAHEAPT